MSDVIAATSAGRKTSFTTATRPNILIGHQEIRHRLVRLSQRVQATLQSALPTKRSQSKAEPALLCFLLPNGHHTQLCANQTNNRAPSGRRPARFFYDWTLGTRPKARTSQYVPCRGRALRPLTLRSATLVKVNVQKGPKGKTWIVAIKDVHHFKVESDLNSLV